ncbi:hypothetical protein SETIT_5G006200v2 [Setaria italica]|uniref:Uncharacterized protein n=1 Tax=Setaria italica TaxID=4555 RepID=K3XEC6_SETIT|nr:disease resistance protein RPM1 [Setaria italica]RCV23440.1 hypothetical protein SETIT_5G006200v2 [Setaria italica]
MADLTVGAVNDLLGLLSTAVKEEARLLGGLRGNMQFIKDEMDSMNGFLRHLTQTESEHDDQIRAWMKQVREIAYMAENCVERYVRDIARHDGEGLLDTAYLLLLHPKKYIMRRNLAKKILELKVRVNDIGERRKRYDVKVPDGPGLKKAAEDGAAAAAKEEKRDAFRRLLEQAIPDSSRPAVPSSISEEVIRQLPPHVRSQDAPALVQATWKKCCPPAPAPPPDGETLRCIRMLLCALYAYRYKTNNLELDRLKKIVLGEKGGTAEEIKLKIEVLDEEEEEGGTAEESKLKKKVLGEEEEEGGTAEESKLKKKVLGEEEEEEGGTAEEIKNQVMIFCYSLLSIPQKSCLLYLTAFLEEKAISRTSLVRRWVAEGLVGKEEGRTDEEVGESYFNDLLFRGFIHPARTGDAGTVKSCQPLAGSIRTFITKIAKNENFVIDLPIHLDRQLTIRKKVVLSQQLPPQQAASGCCWSWRDVVGAMDDYCGCCCCWRDDNPMDDLVGFLNSLPELYRLNVLDLGGCRGLKPRHIEAICTVVCLKYLSLRKTDVFWLPPTHLKKLKLLETLDIRETPRLRPRDVGRMYLHSLKHLLAGRYVDKVTGEELPTARRTSAEVSLVTVRIPSRIDEMTSMETLSHVQVSEDGAELGRVGKLRKLRKLGVVIRRVNRRGAQQLRGVIYALAGCLRSLSIWVTQDQGGVLDISVLQEATSSLVLENLDINGRIGTSLPSWVERAGKLANISLRDTEMSGGETLTRLANVLSLRCLKLSRRSFLEQALIFRDDVHFKALKFLVVDGDTITSVTFAAAGAAPELEKIVWSISKPHSGDLISGIDRLPNLKEIEIRGNFNVNNLLQAIGSLTDPPVTSYRCRYVYLSDLSDITVVKKAKSDTTLSVPVGVINQQQQ